MGDTFTGLLDSGLAGVGGKALGDAFGKADQPGIPDFLKAALATSNANRYTESGPYGSVGWSLRPGADPNNPQLGDYIRTTTLAPEQQKLFDQGVQNELGVGGAVSGQLSDLGSGSKAVADALYSKQTQYLDQNFGDQTRALETQLQNQGLARGSEAFDREMRNLRQAQNGAYTTASNNAVIGADTAQNNIVSRIASLLANSKAGIPTSGNTGAGADYTGAATSGYNALTGQVNAENAQKAQTLQQLGQLGATAAMAFSDRRLKSNITCIGKAGNGLNIYEYDIFGKRERGHMADEVRALYPEAVHTHDSGFLVVDYATIGGRP